MCMNTSPNVLERLKLLRSIGIDFNFFNQIAHIVVSRKVTIRKFKMLFILDTKDDTELES